MADPVWKDAWIRKPQGLEVWLQPKRWPPDDTRVWTLKSYCAVFLVLWGSVTAYCWYWHGIFLVVFIVPTVRSFQSLKLPYHINTWYLQDMSNFPILLSSVVMSHRRACVAWPLALSLHDSAAWAQWRSLLYIYYMYIHQYTYIYTYIYKHT